MQDAKGQGFCETAPMLEYASPACPGSQSGASGRGGERARFRAGGSDSAACPNRPQPMRRAHADHDIA